MHTSWFYVLQAVGHRFYLDKVFSGLRLILSNVNVQMDRAKKPNKTSPLIKKAFTQADSLWFKEKGCTKAAFYCELRPARREHTSSVRGFGEKKTYSFLPQRYYWRPVQTVGEMVWVTDTPLTEWCMDREKLGGGVSYKTTYGSLFQAHWGCSFGVNRLLEDRPRQRLKGQIGETGLIRPQKAIKSPSWIPENVNKVMVDKDQEDRATKLLRTETSPTAARP